MAVPVNLARYCRSVRRAGDVMPLSRYILMTILAVTASVLHSGCLSRLLTNASCPENTRTHVHVWSWGHRLWNWNMGIDELVQGGTITLSAAC
jgi:hypothetical protein